MNRLHITLQCYFIILYCISQGSKITVVQWFVKPLTVIFHLEHILLPWGLTRWFQTRNHYWTIPLKFFSQATVSNKWERKRKKKMQIDCVVLQESPIWTEWLSVTTETVVSKGSICRFWYKKCMQNTCLLKHIQIVCILFKTKVVLDNLKGCTKFARHSNN